MKSVYILLVFSVLTLPFASFADGFKCAGQGYKAKFFDRVDPVEGKSVPAVLVISSDEDGVVSVIRSEGLERLQKDGAFVYKGTGKQGKLDVKVDLTIRNELPPEGDLSKNFEGSLLVKMSDGYEIRAELECTGYVKR